MAFKMRGFPMMKGSSPHKSALHQNVDDEKKVQKISDEEFANMTWQQRDKVFDQLTKSQKNEAMKEGVAREEKANALLYQASKIEDKIKTTTDQKTKDALIKQKDSLYQQARDLGEDIGD